MSYEIRTSSAFQKQFKKLWKRYRSLPDDLRALKISLNSDPTQGAPVGKNCYKIRLAITSKNKGKSGGARIITSVHIVGKTIYLLSIYDKSSKSSLDEGELDALLLEIEA